MSSRSFQVALSVDKMFDSVTLITFDFLVIDFRHGGTNTALTELLTFSDKELLDLS